MKEKLKRFVELHVLMKQYKEEKDKLSKELVKEFGNEARTVDWFSVSKWEKVSWKLKDEYKDKESDLVKRFPEYTKFNLNSFAKEKEKEAGLIAEKNVTTFLTPRKKS